MGADNFENENVPSTVRLLVLRSKGVELNSECDCSSRYQKL